MDERRSPLHAAHESLEATFTDFGGWQMPVEFHSIRQEHDAVRASAGRFDVSHMGQIHASGPEAPQLVQRLVTNDVTGLSPGQAIYTAVTNESGVMLDDILVYRLPAEDAYLLVPNAGADRMLRDRLETYRDRWELEADIENRTEEYGMIALQGPAARRRARDVIGPGVLELERFEIGRFDVDDAEWLVARTGYTGEDGLEVITETEAIGDVWNAFEGAQPCGLGARDTPRLEAGLVLAGQEFHPTDQPRTPYEAGIGFAVKLNTEFVGRDALEQQAAEGPAVRRVGLRLIDRGIPRSGYAITTRDGETIGSVTSGTMSPTLGVPIGMGYVPIEYATVGTILRVTIRGEPKKARVETMPFVDTAQ